MMTYGWYDPELPKKGLLCNEAHAEPRAASSAKTTIIKTIIHYLIRAHITWYHMDDNLFMI